jgi:hypothetical protein
MAKRTVADILASTGPVSLTADLGDGHSVPISVGGSVGAASTVDVEELVSAVLGGGQKTDKAGRMKAKGPDAPITAEGVDTGRIAKRTYARSPEVIAACLYASCGLDVPEDLLPDEEPSKPDAKPAKPKAKPAPVPVGANGN